MKNFKKYLFAVLVCSLLLSSCSKYEETSGTSSETESSMVSDSSTASGDESAVSEESSEEEDSMFDFSVLTKEELAQYITLGEYKGFESEKVVVEVTDKDIEKATNSILTPYGELKAVEDRAVKEGDYVTIDFVGYLDGKTFEGGSATDQSLTVGEGKYIEGFEEGIVGVKKGETVSIDISFPEDYGKEELNGKPVTFEITVKSIQEYILPELSEKIIKESTNNTATTVEEFNEYLKDKLYKQMEFEKTYESVSKYWQKGLDAATVVKYPDGVIESYVKSYFDYYSQMATLYGTTFESLLGMTEDEFKADCKKTAEEQYKDRMFLYATMHAENYDYNIVKEEYDAWLTNQAEMMETTIETLTQQYSTETLEYTYIYDTFRNYLYEFRVETEPTSEESSKTTSTEASTEE